LPIKYKGEHQYFPFLKKKKSNIFSPKSATKNLNETGSNITLLPMFQGSHCYKYARGRGEGRKEISNSETKGNVRR